MPWHHARAVSLALSLLLAAEARVSAETLNWIGGVGSWTDPENWDRTPPRLPDESDYAVIENGGTTQLTENATVVEVSVGSDVGTSGTLEVASGARLTTSFPGFLGQSGEGTVLVYDGATWTIDGGEVWQIGYESRGTLAIASGGQVSNPGSPAPLNPDSATLGSRPGSFGWVTVSDATSKWTTGRDLTVGYHGQGVLDILSGGEVDAGGSAYIGRQPNSTGNVRVEGADAKWTIGGGLVVGGEGNGRLDILNGGAVSDGVGLVFPHGTVLVQDSTWTNTSTLRVRSGRLDIQGGGTVFSGRSLYVEDGGQVILYQANGLPALIVSDEGAGSVPVNPGISVGSPAGTGYMAIRDGGIVTSGLGHDARVDGLDGTRVEVTGEFARWWWIQDLTIGGQFDGELDILGGGYVTYLGNGHVGLAEGSTGKVIVYGSAGPGLPSRLEGGGPLMAGGSGTGLLEIRAGAQVTSTGAIIGHESSLTGNGMVVVDGWGSDGPSSWNVGGPLVVGNFGDGTLSITNRGRVESTGVEIGKKQGLFAPEGIVTVDGNQSELYVDGDLMVGDEGTGKLYVTSGGHVENQYGTIGFLEGSNGTVVVDDGTWVNHKTLLVGFLGDAVLDIRNFGVVDAREGTFIGPGGEVTGGGGVLFINDGTTLVNKGVLAPGASPGTLTIDGDFTNQPGGRVELEIGGTAPEDYDHLVITGDADLGGEILLQIIDGFLPQTGDQFELLDVGGTFDFSAEVSYSGVAGGWEFDTAFDPGTGLFVLTSLNNAQPVPEPANWLLASAALVLFSTVQGRRRSRRGVAGNGS